MDTTATTIKSESSLAPAVSTLLERFYIAEQVLATSEQDKLDPFLSSASSELCNSEHSPYGCDETVSSLGMRLWGYQLGAQFSLQDLVVEHLPIPLKHSARRFLPWDDPQELVEKLEENGLINPDILTLFRSLGIEELTLTNSLGPDPISMTKVNPRPTLRVFQQPHSFKDLAILSLKKVPLADEDVACLSNLRVNDLDLSYTGISSEATAHLVALKPFLTKLELGHNGRIQHPSCYNLACLTSLRTLCLIGTNVKMLSLRYIVNRLVYKNGSDSPVDLHVPATCRKYLEGLSNKYQSFIPDPYITMKTVRKLKSMNYAGVRKNLEFHHVKDKKVSLHGTVDDMVKRLRKLLKTRETDIRLKSWANIA